MTRRALLILLPLSALTLGADQRSDILDIVTPLASALSAGDSQAFLGGFDRKMPGFDDLAGWVTGLLDAYEITSSVDLFEIKGEDIDLDWSLRLRSRVATGKSDDRRDVVTIRIGKGKKITSLRPLEFFKS